MKTETKQIKWEANGLLVSESESPYREVCHLGDSEFPEEKAREHAALIVRAVNSHEALLETLRAVYPLIGRGFVQVGTKLMDGKSAILAAIAAAEMEVPS